MELSNLCTGCSACEAVCPVNAINMDMNGEGFYSWNIDNAKCIECGLCIKTCPQFDKNINLLDIKETYGATLKNLEIIQSSTSGGLFYTLSSCVLGKNGVVYGAAFDKDFQVRHIRVSSIEALHQLQGSKYVQSKIHEIFPNVLQDLNTGKLVLFSGTPCQVSGLKKYLNKEYPNLYAIDILCHGVPSAGLFQNYKKWHEKKYNVKWKSYSFRYKDHGIGGRYLIHIESNRKKFQHPIMLDQFGDSFLKGSILNECCYTCQYATNKRIGDISLGDFWEFKDRKDIKNYRSGVSLVTINTEKGHSLFNKIKDEVDYILSSEHDAIKCNQALRHPTKRPNCRNDILTNINRVDIFETALNPGMKLKLRISNLIPITIKEKLKQ